MWVHVSTARVWRSDDSLQRSVLFSSGFQGFDSSHKQACAASDSLPGQSYKPKSHILDDLCIRPLCGGGRYLFSPHSPLACFTHLSQLLAAS